MSEKIMPDKKTMKQLLSRLIHLKKLTDSALLIGEGIIFEINEIIIGKKESYLKDKLAKIPIENINFNKSSVRISALKKAGINDVYKLLSYSRQQLIKINGLGKQSADTALNHAAMIKNLYEKRFKIRLNPHGNDKDKRLIHLLYVYRITEDLTRDIKTFRDKYGELIRVFITNGKRLKSWLYLLLASEKKKQYLLSSFNDSVCFLENDITKFAIEQGNYIMSTFHGDMTTALGDFAKDSVTYYTLLEEMLGYEYDEYGQNKEIASKINAFGADFSLIKTKLRKYQYFGAKFILCQKRVLLGDEMGLGKTIQAIAAMAHLQAKGGTSFLVVCPLSVVVNWVREIQKHSGLRAFKIHGDKKEALYAEWIENGGIAVTNYETAKTFSNVFDKRLDMLVVDEAHYVKNPDTDRTAAVRRLLSKTEYALYMTGTPMENKIREMCFLLNSLKPELNIAEGVDRIYEPMEFKERISEVYLRRDRDDVWAEMPEKLEISDWCDMNGYERERYIKTLMYDTFMEVRRVSWNVGDYRRSTKAERLMDICGEAIDEGRKVVVFSFFLDTVHFIVDMFGTLACKPIYGSVSSEERQAIIDEFTNRADKKILVCQIQTGGTGMNIQAASVVVICEPQFKPSIEEQAVSRVYRMGQTRNVIVHRLLSENTIDEEIMKILYRKQELFDIYAKQSDHVEESIINSSNIAEIMEKQLNMYGVKRDAHPF
ncbi:MAG: SNF2-related protein [Clostridium sp.]|nr:SNF2-related protein [Clostridium sp.]MCM1209482.1 SNF2-related protein [Ruminococcus sp.]